jgi:hypothetical protein
MLDTLLHQAYAWALGTGVLIIVGAIARLLVSPHTLDAVKALGAKLAAQTNQLVAQADASNNLLLQAAAHGAMAYAETHEAEVLKLFDSKADYVIASIQANPKFEHMNLPLSDIKNLIEQLYLAYFAGLPHKVVPAPTPVETAVSPV